MILFSMRGENMQPGNTLPKRFGAATSIQNTPQNPPDHISMRAVKKKMLQGFVFIAKEQIGEPGQFLFLRLSQVRTTF
jgi:hypothetical protein